MNWVKYYVEPEADTGPIGHWLLLINELSIWLIKQINWINH